MAIVTRGFKGRPRRDDSKLPPGHYLTDGFPVRSAGPTPRIIHDRWEFVIFTESGTRHRWSWAQLLALPAESPLVDLRCVTKWSKFDAPGMVARCPRCDHVVPRIVRGPDSVWLDLRGTVSLRIPLPAPDGA